MKGKKTIFEIQERNERRLVTPGLRHHSEARMEAVEKAWNPRLPERYFSTKLRQIQMKV